MSRTHLLLFLRYMVLRGAMQGEGREVEMRQPGPTSSMELGCPDLNPVCNFCLVSTSLEYEIIPVLIVERGPLAQFHSGTALRCFSDLLGVWWAGRGLLLSLGSSSPWKLCFLPLQRNVQVPTWVLWTRTHLQVGSLEMPLR